MNALEQAKYSFQEYEKFGLPSLDATSRARLEEAKVAALIAIAEALQLNAKQPVERYPEVTQATRDAIMRAEKPAGPR